MSHDEIVQYAIGRAHYKANQLIGRHGFTQSDFGDIRQELLTDVIERLPKFNGDLAGAKTFVSRLIDNRIANLIEHRKAGCRNPQREECSLDDWARDEDGAWVRRDTVTDAQRLRAHRGVYPREDQEQAELAMDVDSIVAALPEDLRDLCERLKTQTVLEISRDTGVSCATLYRRIKNLRERFEAAGLGDSLAG